MNLTPKIPTYSEWKQRNKELSELEVQNRVDFVLSYVARALELADNMPIVLRYNWKDRHLTDSEIITIKNYLFELGYVFTYMKFSEFRTFSCTMTLNATELEKYK